MAKRVRIVWSEGLLLTPQHLQYRDRFQEQFSADLFRAAGANAYGMTALQLDADAIHNGQILLESGAGVTPGGLPFAFPDEDDVPAGRTIGEHFTTGMNSLPIYLGVRVHRPGEASLPQDELSLDQVRYLPVTSRIHDEVQGGNDREVELGKYNFRILFPQENLADYDHLQIAEVVRKGEGGYEYRETYVPPCLSIGASAYVQKVLNRLLELLVARSKSLSDRRQHRGQGVAEFGRDDVSGFWLLGTVNGYIPLLSHYLRGKNNHPEQVYLTLAAMAGELTTMSDLEVRDTPSYEHERLGDTFTALAERLPRMLKEVLPQNYDRIPLTPRDELTQVGAINDERLLDPKVGFYLGVYSSMPAPEIQAQFPLKVKIAPPDQVDLLISAAMPGVMLRHVPTLPSGLPVQSGYVYFQIEKSGDVWGLVAGARSMAIYAPPEFPGLNLELIALKG